MQDKITPAIKDPVTESVYTGLDHAAIAESCDANLPDDMGDRIMYEYSHKTDNTGFVCEGEFYTRLDAMKKWGIWTSQDLNKMKANLK